MSSRPPRTDAARVSARQDEALRRRLRNEPWPQLVAAMRGKCAANNYTVKQAARDVTEALREAQARLSGEDDAKDLLRVLELERLDAWSAHAEEILADSRRTGDRLDALRALDRLLRISARRDILMALSETAEVPPNPESDEVDELQAKREEKMLQRASGQP